ncbi:MAG: VanZ family protein [Oscillochloris sp.]|nr:VanZ family protein [Oscillochloris sp.]
MLRTTSARLAAALLGYFVLVIVLLTLFPFYLVLPNPIEISLRVAPDDIVENLILFLPIGFLYRLTGGRPRGAVFLGAALSASVEFIQIFLPVRTASPVDLVINTLGAGLGVWLYDQIAAHIAMTPTMVGRLALEIPLMGLMYMLVPLLWMNALALRDAPDRWVLTAMIAASGAIVLSDIYRAWWGPAGLWSAGRMALTAGAWFLIGSGPRLLHPLPTIPLTLGVVLLTAGLAALPWRSTDRRFERTTLRRILPGLALYLLLAALWPPFQPLSVWHGTLGLTDRIEPVTSRYPAPLLEYLAAFTLLGYVSAEWRGRAELPLTQDLPRLLLITLGSALTLELLVGFQSGHGASLVRAVLVVAGALFGGIIYHLQRDYVRFLLGRGPE